jgi:hypothetical protein
MTVIAQSDSPALVTLPLTVEAAILRTVIYADVFDYALTLPELHRYLIGECATCADLQVLLESSRWLTERIRQVNGYYILTGREELVETRLRRARQAERLWKTARTYARWLALLPFVRCVAVTGALAMNNVEADADVDYLIVTVPGRVWLARAFSIVLVRWARFYNEQLCPNYLLATTALQQDRRDLFVAHELAQMVPLAGGDVYWQMRTANGWAADFLPNAVTAPRSEPDLTPTALGRFIQRLAELFLGGRLGHTLEAWERIRKTARFQPQLDQSGSAARFDGERVQGHFNDYGHKALKSYEERCKRLGV